MKKLIFLSMIATVCVSIDAKHIYKDVDCSGQEVTITKTRDYTRTKSERCDAITFHRAFWEPAKTSIFDTHATTFGKHFCFDGNNISVEQKKIALLLAIQKDDQWPGSEKKLGIKQHIDDEFNAVLARKAAHVKFLQALEEAAKKDPAVVAARAEYEKACKEPAGEQK